MPKIKYRYCCSHSDILIELLNKNHIEYNISDFPTISCKLVNFDIISDKQIDEALEKHLVTIEPKPTCFVTKIYNPKEMRSAQWFSMWCDNMKIEELPNAPAYEYQCRKNELYANHRKQVRPFTLRKNVKWGTKRGFIAAMGDPTLLFISARTKDLLLQYSVSNIDFFPVINFSTNLPFDDVYQMIITNILPDEALIIDEADNCQKKTCGMCGKVQYWIDGTYQLKVKGNYLSTEHDVYATNKLFGAGFARREIIVSRRFYEIIQANKLGRTLHFEPILID